MYVTSSCSHGTPCRECDILGDEHVLREVVDFLLVEVRVEDQGEEVAADMARG